MYEDLEAWIDACPDIERARSVRFLQSWLSEMGEEPQRLHYKALQKRHASGKPEMVALWVEEAVATAAYAAPQVQLAAPAAEQQQMAPQWRCPIAPPISDASFLVPLLLSYNAYIVGNVT